jgi:uncharacterized protein YjaG (DUF416 family)
MSTLWTPDGERPVGRREPTSPPPVPPGPPAAGGEIQEQLANTPVEAVVANHAFGLFELAALHLSLDPPNLVAARTAIDACAALIEGMAGRLGDNEAELVQGLSQLRMAFVQIRAAMGDPASSNDRASSEQA